MHALGEVRQAEFIRLVERATFPIDPPMHTSAAAAVQPSANPIPACNAADGVMRWLEEFSARLLGDRYRIVAESGAGVPATLSLSLFDAAPPGAAEAVRRPGLPACTTRHRIPGSSALEANQSPSGLRAA